jgi:hypothetical protein
MSISYDISLKTTHSFAKKFHLATKVFKKMNFGKSNRGSSEKARIFIA